MTEEDIEAIASRAADSAARKAVVEVLLVMGVNATESKALLDMQSDFRHLRESRLGREEFVNKSKLALIGVFVTGILAVLVKGIVAWAQSQGL